MALGEFVYPPILSSSQPAYDYKKDLIINFTIPSMVSIEDIGHIGITIINQSNNTSVINQNSIENDMLCFNFKDNLDYCWLSDKLTNTYSIKIQNRIQ